MSASSGRREGSRQGPKRTPIETLVRARPHTLEEIQKAPDEVIKYDPKKQIFSVSVEFLLRWLLWKGTEGTLFLFFSMFYGYAGAKI